MSESEKTRDALDTLLMGLQQLQCDLEALTFMMDLVRDSDSETPAPDVIGALTPAVVSVRHGMASLEKEAMRLQKAIDSASNL